MSEHGPRSRDRQFVDLAIKRNIVRQAKGCLGDIVPLADCEHYERLLNEAEAILTATIDKATTHASRHASEGS